MPHSAGNPGDREADVPGQGLAVTAEALYLINLLLLPVIAFITLLILYSRNIAQAPPLAVCHLRQTLSASLWEREPLPERQPDGRLLKPNPRYWMVVVPAALAFAFLWALSLLTYLLPPFEIYGNLLGGTLTPDQFRFLTVGTVLLFIEFMFARHLFCRFGCAVGLFQSLAWMANSRAMVVAFETPRAKVCQDCNNACDNVCPMRLKPRTVKRRMFTCTECAQCISACEQVQRENSLGGLLHWVEGDCALPVVSGRKQQPGCFDPGHEETVHPPGKAN